VALNKGNHAELMGCDRKIHPPEVRGQTHATFRALTGHIREPITTHADGWAKWRCPGGSVSLWVEEAALPERGVVLPRST
jgi:hypothetical protein